MFSSGQLPPPVMCVLTPARTGNNMAEFIPAPRDSIDSFFPLLLLYRKRICRGICSFMLFFVILILKVLKRKNKHQPSIFLKPRDKSLFAPVQKDSGVSSWPDNWVCQISRNDNQFTSDNHNPIESHRKKTRQQLHRTVSFFSFSDDGLLPPQNPLSG